MTRVLLANTDQLWRINDAAAALAALPAAMREQIASYKQEQDQLLRLTGKVLLLQLLQEQGQGYTLENVQRTAMNRPYIPDSGLDFSIAHSGNIAVCAISTVGNIGVDIEQIAPIDWLLLEHLFVPEDWKTLLYAPNPLAAFYDLWTFREACLKAKDEDLLTEDRFSFKGWNLFPIDSREDYAACLATKEKSQVPLICWLERL